MPELLTIGHSIHSWEHFLELLRLHRVDIVVDVRSSPHSTRLPHFNQGTLKTALGDAGIKYLFLGAELGARRSERECYADGVARYDKIAQTSAFREGLERLIRGIQTFRPALMCAEKDPLECHRTILVCRHLREAAQIQHILADGTLESHADAEARLMVEERVESADFFMTRNELLAKAYDQRGEKIAFHEAAEPVETI